MSLQGRVYVVLILQKGKLGGQEEMWMVGHLYDQVINVLAYLPKDDCLRHSELIKGERGARTES